METPMHFLKMCRRMQACYFSPEMYMKFFRINFDNISHTHESSIIFSIMQRNWTLVIVQVKRRKKQLVVMIMELRHFCIIFSSLFCECTKMYLKKK